MKSFSLFFTAVSLWGDAGVLVPTDAGNPTQKILTLDEMSDSGGD